MTYLKLKLTKNSKMYKDLKRAEYEALETYKNDLSDYKAFSEYVSNLLLRLSLSNEKVFTCWINSELLSNASSDKVAKTLVFFQLFAQENGLQLSVDSKQSKPNCPFITLSWQADPCIPKQ